MAKYLDLHGMGMFVTHFATTCFGWLLVTSQMKTLMFFRNFRLRIFFTKFENFGL